MKYVKKSIFLILIVTHGLVFSADKVCNSYSKMNLQNLKKVGSVKLNSKVCNYLGFKYPLFVAAALGDYNFFIRLIDAGANPRLLDGPQNMPILIVLILQNKIGTKGSLVNAFTKAIQHGADINSFVSSTGDTVLHTAVIRNKPELVKLLLDKGADVTKNRSGKNALDIASISNTSPEIKKMLIDYATQKGLVSKQQSNPVSNQPVNSANALFDDLKKIKIAFAQIQQMKFKKDPEKAIQGKAVEAYEQFESLVNKHGKDQVSKQLERLNLNFDEFEAHLNKDKVFTYEFFKVNIPAGSNDSSKTTGSDAKIDSADSSLEDTAVSADKINLQEKQLFEDLKKIKIEFAQIQQMKFQKQPVRTIQDKALGAYEKFENLINKNGEALVSKQLEKLNLKFDEFQNQLNKDMTFTYSK